MDFFWNNGEKQVLPLLFMQEGTRSQLSLSDAFLFIWTNGLFYAFPVIPLLPKVLWQIRQEKARLILISLGWLRQMWLRDLHDLSGVLPIYLPLIPDLVWNKGSVLHPNLSSLRSTVWLLTG